MPMPAAVVTPISTIAERDRSAGRSSRATAVASGTRPNPAPCSTRPARNAGNPAGSAGTYFQAVARHQHVSRAAADLRVAQPALSRAIARLEAELGVPLFDRRGRRVRLNRFGAMFLVRAGRALDELGQGQRE